ncbi:MAG TPA: hypothetical protein VM689_01840 [Aliidongia sp.]|nr:hypothetical protein [Aliidongia sp.]
MLRLSCLTVAALSLVACDAPDPASFKHALRAGPSTGSHIAGVGDGLNETSTENTHFIERLNEHNNAQPAGR